MRHPLTPRSTLFPYTTLFRSSVERFAGSIGFGFPVKHEKLAVLLLNHDFYDTKTTAHLDERSDDGVELTYNLSEPRKDRKSTRLNSSHGYISYAVFCLKKKKP